MRSITSKNNTLAVAVALLVGSLVGTADAVTPPKLEVINQVNFKTSYAVTIQGKYAYTGDEGILKILDVSDPKNPTVIGSSASMPDGVIMDIVAKGNYVYVANARGGLRILDVSNPQSPVEVGVYNTNQPNDGNDWTLWGVSVRDNYAYVADMASGLRIIDITNPAQPTEVSFVASHGLTHAVKLNGNFAYMVDWSGGLGIIDITDPRNPKEISFIATKGLTYGVDFSKDGKLLYIADYDGLRVVDISQPNNPQDIGFFDTPGIATVVVADGNYVYVNSSGELRVIDVSDPKSLLQIDSYTAPENGSGYGLAAFKLNNGFLYVPNRNGLIILSNGLPISLGCEDRTKHATFDTTKGLLSIPALDIPTLDPITGEPTGALATFSGQLNLLKGVEDFGLVPDSFKVVKIDVAEHDPCHAEYIYADGKFSKGGTLHLPYVDVPSVIVIPPNVQIPGPVRTYDATLKQLALDLMIFHISDYKLLPSN